MYVQYIYIDILTHLFPPKLKVRRPGVLHPQQTLSAPNEVCAGIKLNWTAPCSIQNHMHFQVNMGKPIVNPRTKAKIAKMIEAPFLSPSPSQGVAPPKPCLQMWQGSLEPGIWVLFWHEFYRQRFVSGLKVGN